MGLIRLQNYLRTNYLQARKKVMFYLLVIISFHFRLSHAPHLFKLLI